VQRSAVSPVVWNLGETSASPSRYTNHLLLAEALWMCLSIGRQYILSSALAPFLSFSFLCVRSSSRWICVHYENATLFCSLALKTFVSLTHCVSRRRGLPSAAAKRWTRILIILFAEARSGLVVSRDIARPLILEPCRF
jgi:hypothetical protein